MMKYRRISMATASIGLGIALTCSFVAVIIAFLLFNTEYARASFIDFDPQDPGAQTASWPEPSTIMIFIPDALAGANRMNFEMGINALANCLSMIMVQFKNGDPPANAQNFVDVNIVNMNTPPFGVTTPTEFTPDGQNHGNIQSAMQDIDQTALGNANFMKNLGAHEFGHVLGLDEDPREGGMRINVMDPDFNMDDPFIGPAARDKMMLS